ncbi:MAG: 3-isopropylmalate dehydratase large subunit [Spirochaetota bacterium]|jgi:3-isopropylmalate/(R)-2-methylmalate dehydratase large subunit|nr:3-isopropylmalate dehydratase large subunit [Spirochaetota bacterium]
MGRTIAEKIFDAHLVDKPDAGSHVLRLDAVFCHEITTPIAIQELRERGMESVFDPARIKAVIDHVSPAKDSLTAEQGKVLRDWARRSGIRDFFDIGRNGVCHALFPEQGFARPGMTIIMGDSHTCTHGAFGAFAAGVGTTDLAVGIHKGVAVFREPKSIRFILNGKLRAGVYAKDVILYIIGQIGTDGATNCVMEFCGEAVTAMSMESRMTICNMAVEAGASSGICAPDAVTADYLWPFISAECTSKEEALASWMAWHSDPDAEYEKTFQYDVSAVEPMGTFGYKPDQVKTIRELEGTHIDQVYIGSCTNGRIEDLRVAADVLRGKKIADSVRAILSPATPAVYSRALDEGLVKIFMDAGVCLTNPTCGACLGMSNGVLASGETAASTTNRNFNGRMGKGGMIHLMSPASAAAAALAGHIRNSALYTAN